MGAICLGPVTLANAGVLGGRGATCVSLAEAHLRQKGATLERTGVVVNGTIVTADGAQSSRAFAEALVSAWR